jgi:hypothetical protein
MKCAYTWAWWLATWGTFGVGWRWRRKTEQLDGINKEMY